MGIISDVKAMKDVQRIKNGGTAKLSISQITGLITNMMDAKNNLTTDQFNEVYKLFQKYRKNTVKKSMNIDDYLNVAVDIIKEFDRIAPYEKYSGGNEEEFRLLMEDIRAEQKEEKKIKKNIDIRAHGNSSNKWEEFLEKNIKNEGTKTSFADIRLKDNAKDEIDENSNIRIKENKYNEKGYNNPLDFINNFHDDINSLVNNSNGIINDTIAIKFIKIIEENPELNKKAILYDFDAFAKELIKENPAYSLAAISYFLGVLNGNKIITENEMNKKLDEYQTMITDSMMNNPKDGDMETVKKFAVNIQREFLASIDETSKNKELRGIAGLIAFKTMMVYGARFYDGCEDEDKSNYNWTDDNSYLALHFMYMIWFLIFREADDSITKYQNASSKREYDKYMILFYETFTKYTDILRHWHEIEKPKFIDFYENFEKDMDELIDIGKYPAIFEFPKGREKLLNKLIEDNKNGIPIDPKLNK